LADRANYSKEGEVTGVVVRLCLRRILLFVGLAFVAVPVGSALAATATIGQTGSPNSDRLTTGIEAAEPGIFAPGKVTSFQFQAADGFCYPPGPGSFDFQVLRPLGGDQYQVVGHTGTQIDSCDGKLHSYPVDITVQARDLLGVFSVFMWRGILSANGPAQPQNFLGDQPKVGDTIELPLTQFGGPILDESATLVFSFNGNGKNTPNGTGPIANPSPQTPNGSPQGCDNGAGWKIGTEARC
jgi:hypothetical protein